MKIAKRIAKGMCLAACICAAAVPLGVLTGCNSLRGPAGRGNEVVNDIEFDDYGKPIFIDENGKGVTLNVWSVVGAPDNTYLNIVNKSFNDTNRVNGLQANISSIDTFQFYTQIVNTINTDPKNAPDVIIMHSERLTYHVDQNVIVPISDVFDKLGEYNTFSEDNYLENVIAECYATGKTDDGAKLYGVPLDVHSGVWFVRKDIIEKNGLSMPTDKNSFEAVCEALMQKKQAGELWVRSLDTVKTQIDALADKFDETAKSRIRENAWHKIGADVDFYPVEMSGGDNIESGWIPQSAVLQNGGKLVAPDGTPAWNESAGLKSALEMIHGWRDKYIGKNRGNETMWVNFGGGNAVFACEGPWFMESRLNEYDNYLGEGAMGFLGLSKLYADDVNSADASKIYGVGHAVCITNSQNNTSMTRRLAAAMYAQYLTENSARYTEGGHIPACKLVLNSDEYKNSTAYNRYLKYMGEPENYVMLGNTKYFTEVYEQLKMAYIYTLSKNKQGTVEDFILQCYNNAMESIRGAEDL